MEFDSKCDFTTPTILLYPFECRVPKNSKERLKKKTTGFLSDQCKEIEENNIMEKTRDLFKKIRDTREHFMQRWAR